MRDFTELQKKGYNYITIPEQLKLVMNNAYTKLRMIQQDAISKIKKKYDKNKFLNNEESEYLFNIYYNFIVNGFQYEDKKDIVIKTSLSQHHIGIQMLKQLQS